MIDVIIIGAGGHAAEIDDYVNHSLVKVDDDRIHIVGFLDDNEDNYNRYKFSAPLLGGATYHEVIKGQKYIIGIASQKYRRFFVDRFLKFGAVFITFRHVGAYISESAIIGEGCIIGPNVSIGPNVKIGKYSLINARCSIGHDTKIGNYNIISPNVCFSGFTEIGDENFFGINSATIPGIKVGDRNKVAAGMILDQSIGSDTVVFYRFKEKIIAVPRGQHNL